MTNQNQYNRYNQKSVSDHFYGNDHSWENKRNDMGNRENNIVPLLELMISQMRRERF